MREFFRSWKRKVGVATLMVALAAIGMWLRSQVIEESAGLVLSGRKFSFFSADGEIAFFTSPSDRPDFWGYWWSRELIRGFHLGGPLVVDYLIVALVMILISIILLVGRVRLPKSQNDNDEIVAVHPH